MTIHIDVARALELLREVVAEQPDYINDDEDLEECRYVHNGQCSCLIGHVLHRAGVPVEVVARLDEQPVSSISAVTVPGVDLTTGARRVLAAAQEVQDDMKPWAEALAAAEAIAARVVEAGGAS